MEFLMNSLVGLVLMVFDVIRGLLEWGDKALLLAAAVAAGAYVGTRATLAWLERTASASQR